MRLDVSANGMIKDLRDILINSNTFPKEQEVEDPAMRKALLEFKQKFRPRHKVDVKIRTIEEFVEKHNLFGAVEEYFAIFERLKTTVIMIEGADGTGKTKLSEQIAKDMHGMDIENQSTALFHRMFGLPKLHKVVVVDYNSNILVGFLFYLVVNIVGLGEAAGHAKKGSRCVVLDSSFLRTFASHLAHPSDLKRRNSPIKINRRLHVLIKNNLNRRYLKILKEARHSLFIVFLYASDTARLAQVKQRTKTNKYDTNDYDTNTKYSRITVEALKRDELSVKREKIPAISMLMVSRSESNSVKKMKTTPADIIFVRTGNVNSDVAQKAKIIRQSKGSKQGINIS